MKQKPVHWPTTPQGKDHNYPITPYSSFSTQDMEGTQLFSELMNKIFLVRLYQKLFTSDFPISEKTIFKN